MRIAIEGGEGTGKSTLIKWLEQELEGSIVVSEGELPGQEKALVYKLPVSDQAEVFAKERARLNHEVYLNEANEDVAIIQDRSVFSSMVYQSLSGEMTPEEVLDVNVRSDGEFALPDMVVLLNSDPKFNRERMLANGRHMDEQDLKPIEFHESVRQAYKDILIKPARVCGVCHVNEIPIYDLELGDQYSVVVMIENAHDLTDLDLRYIIRDMIAARIVLELEQLTPED